MFKKYSLKNYNFILFLLVLGMMTFGVIVIKSINPAVYQKQAIGLGLAFVIMIVISLIDYHLVAHFYMIIYTVGVILLAMVLFVGSSGGGAKRWVDINGITFQPSELEKIILILFQAKMLSDLKEEDKIDSFKCIFLFTTSLAVPLLLIVKEPDLSTTVCITLVMITMIYLAGLSYKVIIAVLLIFIPLASLFMWYVQKPDQVLLDDYQRNRIMSFLYPSEYAEQGLTDQQDNSVLGIGSGELNGKGLYPDESVYSVKNSKLVSEQHTDFIFSAIGEAFGFIGSIILLGIMLLIVLQCIRVGRHARDDCGKLIAFGMGCLIGYQTYINIGVTTKLLPNTGLPLPFVSYGLSSLVSMAIGMGLVLNVALQKRKY